MTEMKTCERCAKTFEPKSLREANRYCSRECYQADLKEKGRPDRMVARVKFTCGACGETFEKAPGELRSYRKQWGKDPLYCSTKCGGVGRKLADEAWQVSCVQCGKPMPIQRKPGGTINRQKRLCSTACRSRFRQESAAKRFNANGAFSRHMKRGGYMWISIPALANPSGKKISMLEHRYVMEQHLGRALLTEETVHHKNGDRAFNDLSNLELFSSHHGPGQRVVDKVAFAIEMLRLYPKFARAAGVELRKIGGEGGHVEGALSLSG